MTAEQDPSALASVGLSEDELAWMAAGDALATASPDEDAPSESPSPVSSHVRRRPWWVAAGAGVAVIAALGLGVLRGSLHEGEAPALAAALSPPPAPPEGHRGDDATPEPPTAPRPHAKPVLPARKAGPTRLRSGPRAPAKAGSTAAGTERQARTGPHVSSPASALRR